MKTSSGPVHPWRIRLFQVNDLMARDIILDICCESCPLNDTIDTNRAHSTRPSNPRVLDSEHIQEASVGTGEPPPPCSNIGTPRALCWHPVVGYIICVLLFEAVLHLSLILLEPCASHKGSGCPVTMSGTYAARVQPRRPTTYYRTFPDVPYLVQPHIGCGSATVWIPTPSVLVMHQAGCVLE